jgi:hypothetical protein
MPTRASYLSLLFFVILLVGSAVQATPVLIDSSFSASHFIDNQNGSSDDDEYSMILERLRLRGSTKGLTAGLRLDNTIFGGNKGPRRTESRLERIYANIERGRFRITAGDFYKQLGRGLLLALRKVDEVGFDVVLRGVDASFESGAVKLTLFGGRTNSVNIDNLKNKFVEDPNDILAGTEVKGQIGSVAVGLHGLHRRNEDGVSQSAHADASNSVGAYTSGSFVEGQVSLYLEGAFQQTRLADQLNAGHALYGTLDLVFADLVATIETIELSDFTQSGSRKAIKGQAGDAFRYNQAPTLERIDQETSKGIDERGGRLMMQYSLLEGDLTLSSSALYKVEFPDKASELTTLHTFGGFECGYDLGRSRVALTGGYRDLSRTGGATVKSFKQMEHAETTILQHLTGRTSLRLASAMEFRTLEGSDYVRGSNFAGLENGKFGSLTFEYGIDNARSQSGIRNHFYAGILSANIMRGLVVKSIVGTQRGGLKCVAGICRDYPSFAGARVDVLYTKYL